MGCSGSTHGKMALVGGGATPLRLGRSDIGRQEYPFSPGSEVNEATRTVSTMGIKFCRRMRTLAAIVRGLAGDSEYRRDPDSQH